MCATEPTVRGFLARVCPSGLETACGLRMILQGVEVMRVWLRQSDGGDTQ